MQDPLPFPVRNTARPSVSKGAIMDTRQLQTFITLSETLNYQRAADQLQYAPSSLFKHIQLLEEEIATFMPNER